MLFSYKAFAASFLFSQALGCIYFNATLEGDNKLSVHSWDDANNNNATNPEDIICNGDQLDPVGSDPLEWNVECSKADNAESDTVFDVFLSPTNKRFLDIIYRYSNPNAANLQHGENPDEFYFNFRVGSVDGRFFKAREACGQYDLLRLVKPEALKNPCDSLDTC